MILVFMPESVPKKIPKWTSYYICSQAAKGSMTYVSIHMSPNVNENVCQIDFANFAKCLLQKKGNAIYINAYRTMEQHING